MLRSLFRAAALTAAAAFVVSCNDTTPTGSPPRNSPSGARADIVPGTCTTLSNLQSLVNTVFGAGSPSANSVLGKLSNLDKQLQQGNLAGAQDQALNIVTFIQQKAVAGGLPGTTAQVQQLIGSVLCYAGLPPDSFLVYPTDAPQVLKDATGKAGVSLQGNTVTVPTLITITILAPGVSPLITKLDTYPGYVLITSSSTLTKTAVVGVCPAADVPTSVLARLRLGHQGVTGFEITPAADASFLDCSTTVGQSTTPKWLKALASLVLPKPLYAAKLFAGGVGGLADSFSPFGPVDTQLSFSGGAGGTLTEFKKTPSGTSRLPSTSPSTSRAPQAAPSLSRAPGARVNTVVSGVCTLADATEGTALEPECRPEVTVRTANGTIITGAVVNWAIGLGGGSIAPEASVPPCTPFGSTATTTTDANGKTRVCWILGATPGTNTVIATPAAGGDAPPGVSFSPASGTFTATANQIVPIATATGGTFAFDGNGHPGSGTCSNGLTPVLTYTGGSVPTNVGTYTLTVTCGAGNPLFTTVSQPAPITITSGGTTTTVTCPTTPVVYTGSALTPCTARATGLGGLDVAVTPLTYTSNTNVGDALVTATYAGGGNYGGSTGSGTFHIAAAPTTATVTCPASAIYTGSPITPCTGRVTGPGALSLTLTPTYSSNVVGTATATVTYAGGGNYLGSTASKTFQISYAQSGCFASPVYSVMPSTKSFQNKGSNLPIKCTLLTASGAGVNNATGDLLVEDLGKDGSATPQGVFFLANAFKVATSGNYAYGLDTAPVGFLSQHFYRVTATWSDGSKTIGFFYIK